jgi:acyl-CoA reductase-like NAD-dependent aldehyde dehydrogenase
VTTSNGHARLGAGDLASKQGARARIQAIAKRSEAARDLPATERARVRKAALADLATELGKIADRIKAIEDGDDVRKSLDSGLWTDVIR